MAKISLYAARLEYIQYMKAQGMADSTISGHQQTLDHAMNAWGNIDLRDLEPTHVDKMFSGKNWSAGTRNGYLMNLRGFFKWCRIHGHLLPDCDPTAGWKTHRVERRKKTWLDIPELNRLLDAAYCERDRAFIALGFYTFMRSSEIVNLKIKDIDLAYDEIDIYRVKTRQYDRLPLCTELRAEMERWFEYYVQQHGTLDPDWLVVPARGPQPMVGVTGERRLVKSGEPAPLKTTTKITKPYTIVRRAMTRIGHGKSGDGCHVLRRSGARELFEHLRADGHDGAARRVQSMLGHTSVTMTEVYLGIDSERRERNRMLSGKSMFGSAA